MMVITVYEINILYLTKFSARSFFFEREAVRIFKVRGEKAYRGGHG